MVAIFWLSLITYHLSLFTFLIAHLRRLDWVLLGSVAVLILIGLVTLAVMWRQGLDDALWKLVKQAVFAVLAFCLIFFVSRVDYRIFRSEPWVLLGLYAAGLVLLMLPFFLSRKIHGTAGWLTLGPFVFQPIELMKLVVLLLLARFFSTRHMELYRFGHLLVSGMYVAVPLLIVMLQPDLGSASILFAIWLGVLFLSGLPLRRFAALGAFGIAVLAIGWFSFFAPYQKSRLVAFLDPGSDPLGAGYHIQQSQVAIGSGGLWGRALEPYSQAGLGFLPESDTDFFFAAYAEAFGFVGILILIVALLILLARIVRVARSTTNNFSRVFSAGFAVWVAAQSMVHIGINLGLLPITGLSLPLASAGGSGLLVLAGGIGILESIRLHQPVLLEIQED